MDSNSFISFSIRPSTSLASKWSPSFVKVLNFAKSNSKYAKRFSKVSKASPNEKLCANKSFLIEA